MHVSRNPVPSGPPPGLLCRVLRHGAIVLGDGSAGRTAARDPSRMPRAQRQAWAHLRLGAPGGVVSLSGQWAAHLCVS